MYHPDQQIPRTQFQQWYSEDVNTCSLFNNRKVFPVLPSPVLPSVKSSSCGSLLTSCENLKQLEEKKQKDE